MRFQHFGLALDVAISYVDVGSKKRLVPMLKPSDFYQNLADLGKLDVLYGQRDPSILQEFWHRFAIIEPHNTIHTALQSGALSPCRTIPMVLHGDEGRGKKRTPMMIVNTHGIIGAGTRAWDKWYEGAPVLKEAGMGVNLKGASMATRFLAFVMGKTSYGEGSCYLQAMFDELAADLVKLQTVGISVGSERWHLVVIGAVGDLQFFSKLCNLTRNYSHFPRNLGKKLKMAFAIYVWLAAMA